MIFAEYKSFLLPDFDRGEILRYAKTNSAEGLPLEECLSEMKDIKGSVVFAEFDVKKADDLISLGFSETSSKDLSTALGDSKKVLVFAATVGILPDKLISKYSKISPTKAVLLQAIGAERIEALCNAFCKERAEFYEKSGLKLKPRFSPGYGDLSLNFQKDIICALNCNKLLGISLTDSLLMMPSKSVTAIVGIYSEKREIP